MQTRSVCPNGLLVQLFLNLKKPSTDETLHSCSKQLEDVHERERFWSKLFQGR